jgi:hypothetical protein
VSERTRAIIASWTDAERMAYGLASIEEFYQALLAAEHARTGSEEQAVANVRAQLRRWRA